MGRESRSSESASSEHSHDEKHAMEREIRPERKRKWRTDFSALLALFLCCVLALSGVLYSIWVRQADDPLGILSAALHRADQAALDTTQHHAGHHWVDTWTTVPQFGSYNTSLPTPFNRDPVALANVTIRQTVALTLGSERIRIRLSNAFGSTPLPIRKVTIALPTPDDEGYLLGSSGVVSGTVQTITFSESEFITIPIGALAVSDPITLDPALPPSQILSISLYVEEGQLGNEVTWHPGSITRSWLAYGDQTTATEMTRAHSIGRWFFISAVEVLKESNYGSLVIIGDSISDGKQTGRNENQKWPALLFERLQGTPGLTDIGVINEAASGNQLLRGEKGPNAPSRLDRDVLARSGLRYVMIFEGVNDIGRVRGNEDDHRRQGDRIIRYYEQIITRVHAAGLPIFAGTIAPFSCEDNSHGWGHDPGHEHTRQRVNEWIRTSGWFDAVIDMDLALQNTADHEQLSPEYKSSDCIHPNPYGHQRMANSFPIEILEQFRNYEVAAR